MGRWVGEVGGIKKLAYSDGEIKLSLSAAVLFLHSNVKEKIA